MLGVGAKVGAGVGLGIGAADLIGTPLFQINFFPDLMQVNVFPLKTDF
ncbi:MAG: hypothetical protein RL288_803 [Actinomycetota bacterium]